jgi:methionine biosynthesis protein MetW
MRADLAIISQWIRPGSHILDLGCGNGELLDVLSEQDISGYGLEISHDNIVRCIEKGVNVIQRDLDAGLSDFDDNSFDYVIMSQTLQAINYPHKLLEDMLRVGHEGIVTFPNFGHWRARLQHCLGGYMPRTRALPNEWYDTPNIHLCTVKDFEKLCRDMGIEILERAIVNHLHDKTAGTSLFPNLFGQYALFRCRRRE